MKSKHLKKSHAVVLACASLIGSAVSSQAAIIIADNFSYGDGGLGGNNGGTGWGSNVWFDTSTNVSGGIAGGTGNASAKRNFGTTLGSTGTVWVRFDWGNSEAPAEWNSYGGLTFYNGNADSPSNENFLFGNPWAYAPTQTFWNISSGSGSPNSTISNTGMMSAIGKLDLAAGTVSLWVDNIGTTIDVSTPADASVSGLNLTNLGGIRINGWSGNSATQSFDNLTIATTLAEVNAIPEPSAALIGGLGLLALLRRRRA